MMKLFRHILLIGVMMVCGSVYGQTKITIALQGSSDSVICDNGNTAFTATVTGCSSPKYQWYKNGVAITSGGTGSSISLNAPNGVANGDVITCKQEDTASGCKVALSNGIKITFKANQALTWINTSGNINQTICQATAIIPIKFQVSGATNATVSGLPTGVTGSYSNGVFTISGTPTQSGSFGYQVQTSGSGLCGSNAQTGGTLTVNPLPNILLNGTGATTFNNQDYFVICDATPSQFDFTNGTTSSGTITNYKIVWGDNTPDFDSPTFSALINHTYSLGINNLNFTVNVGTCSQTKLYKIFVGNVPAGGLTGNGGATICSGQSQTFNLSNVDNNPPGTTYKLDTKDGVILSYSHPPPTSITKFFNVSSCGTSSSNGSTNFNNAFGAYLTIENPCGSLGSSIVPIYVSQKPESNFTKSDSVICVGQNISFNFNGVKGNNVVNQVCTGGKLVWKISPGTINNSYTAISGTLGNDFNSSSVAVWTTGSDNVNIRFDSSGVYSIKLRVGSGSLCGAKDTTLTICVNLTPTASFTTTKDTLCVGDNLTFTNASKTPLCGSNIYSWSVTQTNVTGCSAAAAPTFVSSTNSSSANPVLNFSKPGTYVVSLTTSIKGTTCTSTPFKDTIIVKDKPDVSVALSRPSICQGDTMTPLVNASCFTNTATYSWTFQNGTPATSSIKSPTGIVFNTAGTNNISVTVANNCGNATQSTTINVVASPTLTATPTTTTICNGQTATINLSSNQTGIKYTWTSTVTSGTATGNTNQSTPTSTATINNTINNSGTVDAVITYTIQVIGDAPSNCPGEIKTVTVTVRPGTTPPNAGLNQNLCNVTSATLAGNQPTVGTGTWTKVQGGSATITNPNLYNTTITGLQPDVYLFVWTIIGSSGGSCPNTPDTMQIINRPSITTANAGNDIIICNFSSTNNSITLQGNAASPGRSYETGTWSVVTKPAGSIASFSNINSQTATFTFNQTGNYTLVWTITNDINCTPTTDSVIIKVYQAAVGGTTNTNATVCKNNNTGTITLTGFVGNIVKWQYKVLGSATWVDIVNITSSLNYTNLDTTKTYQAIIATTNTTDCPITATSSQTTITVNPTPSISNLTASSPTQCNTANGSISFNVAPLSGSYIVAYTQNGSSQTTTISTNNGIITIPNLGSGTYANIKVTLANCLSNILGSITLSDPNKPATPIITAPTSICSGSTLNLTAATSSSGAATYNWVLKDGSTVSGATQSIPNITVAQGGVYHVTVTINQCISNDTTVNIAVNQTPTKPITTAKTYCQNDVPTSLTPSGNNYIWYNNIGLTNGSTTVPTPSTTTVGNTTYYVIDSNTTSGCKSVAANLVVTINPTPNISSTSKTDPTQCASSTGSITLNGLTANTSYSVSYNNVVQIPSITTTSTSLTLTGLAAGTYTNISVSLNGCPSNVIASITLSDPTKPATPIVTGNTPICSGGTLQLGFSNTYTGTVTYTWSGPNGFSNTSIAAPSITNITTLGSGDYKLFVTIDNCKSDIGTKSIVVNQTPTAPTTSPLVYCQGATAAALSASGTNLIWYNNVALNNGSLTAPTPITTTVGATTYYVVDSSNAGCKSIPANIVVTVNATPVISNAIPTNPQQCQATNGSISFNVTPTTGSYTITYTKDGGSLQTLSNIIPVGGTLTIPNLGAGLYENIKVILNNCPSNTLAAITLSDPTKPATPIVTGNTPICSGGTLNLGFSNTYTGTVTYTWSGPNGFSNTSNAAPSITSISTLGTGDYKLFVTIDNCKSDIGTKSIVVNQTPTAPTTSPIVYCQGATAASLSASGANLIWYNNVALNNGSLTAPTPITTTVGATTYYVVDSSNAGCKSISANIVVTVNATPVISNPIPTNPQQCQATNGKISFDVTPTTGSYTITYSKDGAAQPAINVSPASGVLTIPNLGAGLYENIKVTLNNCPSNTLAAITLSDPTKPATPIVTGNTPICSGGTLNLGFSNTYTGTVTYTWSGPNGFSNISNAAPSITNITTLGSGDYKLFVTIDNCKSDIGTKSIVVNQTPTTPIVIAKKYCQNEIVPALNPSGNNYVWYNNVGLSNGSTTAPTPSTTTVGTTTYYVIDSNVTTGCKSGVASLIVTVNFTPIITLGTVTDPAQCQAANGSIKINGLPANTSFLVFYVKNGGSQITVPSQQSDASGTVVISNLTAGTYSNIFVTTTSGCSSNTLPDVTLSDPTAPATPIIIGVDSICSGKTLTLTAASPIVGGIYTWTKPNAATTTGTSLTISNIAVANSGVYKLYVTLNLCQSKDTSFSVRVDSTPVIPVVTTNSPVCSDSTIKLFITNTYPMLVSYVWNGMLGFTSTQQNPTISSATAAMAGNYSVTATSVVGACLSPKGTISVTINQSPSIAIQDSTNPSQCATATGSIRLNGLNANTSYNIFYTINASVKMQTQTSDANGVLKIDTLRAGTYSDIYVILNGCPSKPVRTVILKDPTPPATPIIIGVDSICSGKNLTLTAASPIVGGIYTWTKPNAATTTGTSLTINNIIVADSGVYKLYVTLNLCQSKDTSFRVRVDSTPVTPVVATISPICTDSTIKLFITNTYPMLVSYAWNGMLGFTSSQQNPTISNATAAMAGNYSAFVTSQIGGCQSSTGTTAVTINQTPHINFKDSINPTQCATASGSITIKGLLSTTVYTVNYTFNGTPRTVSFTTNATGELKIDTLRAGTYSNINVILNNCPSNSIGSYTLVDPNPPATPIITGVDSICSGKTLTLNAASPIPNAIYTWTHPNGTSFNTTSYSISNMNLSDSGVYKLYVTLNLCQSKDTSFRVRVDSTPVVPIITTNSPVCTDSTIKLFITNSYPMVVNYSWNGMLGFTSSQQNPTISNASAAMAGNYNVTATSVVGACLSAIGTTSATINPTPIISNLLYSNPSQCATATGYITFNVVPISGAYTVNYLKDGVAQTRTITANAGVIKIDLLPAGTYSNITVTLNYCPSNIIGPITLHDPNPPSTPIIIGVDSICSGQNIVLSAASPIANAIYTWTKPNTLTATGTSLAINNISVAESGFYELYVTLNLCKSKDTSLFVRVDSTPVAPVIVTNSPVCSDSTIVLKASTVSPGSMYYSWTGANSFISALQNPTIPNAQLVNAGNYSVFATSQIGSCFSATSSQNVVVNASPNVAAMPDTTYKDAVPSGLIAFNGNVAGTTFNWTNSNPSIGLSASGTGDIVSFTTSNSTPFPIFGIITVTPSTNFCTGKPITFKITVNPTPRLTSPFADTICTDNLWQYQATSSTPNVTFTWVRNTVAGISNAASASTDSSGLINETLTNTTSQPIQVPYIFKLYSLGSVNTDTVKLTVNPDAKALYTFNNDKLCAPGTIDTANIKLQPYALANSSFEWYADGMLIGTGLQFPGYTILNNGDTVKIRLKAISLYGCKSDSFEHSFYNVKTPVASFIKSVANGCGPLSVDFTNTTTPLAYPTYKWDFGNGNTSTLQSPVNIIFREDTSNRRVDTTYYIKLTAYTECDSVSFVDSVTVFAQPKALFQPDTTVGCSIFHFRAFNNSWGQHNTYTWDFGDSTAIVIDTAYGYYYHNFYTAVTDTFNVKLKAVNKCGSDSFEVKIVVFPNTIVPKLIVDGNSNYGCAPIQVRFVNNTVGANKFTIKFGDGSLPYISNKNPDTVYHTYQNGGNFIATLKAQNSCTDSTVALTLQLYDKPQAKFYLSSNQFCKKETIQFKNLSDSTLSFEWWFGDGGTSTNLHPTHRYLNVGNYTITLIAKSTNPTGAVCTDTIRKTITVHDLPVSAFTNNAAIQNCQPYYFVGITNLLPSEIANWTFSDSFSNDTTQAGNVGVHTFKQVGIYQVQLVIFNVHGCTDTSSTKVKVIETPKVAFTMSDTLSCIPGKSVTCINQTTYSAADAVNYQWYVNGVLQTTTKDFNYNFNVPLNITVAANFTVKLVAINSYGCKDSATKLFVIYPKAQTSFAINAAVGCVPFRLQFNNTTQYANLFNWYLDGQLFSTSAVPNPIVLSNPATTYNIKLVANHTLGCGADSVTKQFTTYTKPVADFLIPNKNSCTGILNIQCFDLSSVVGASITKWNWIFGDGATDTIKNPTHTYNTAGHFNVGLVATDNRGCKSDIAYQVVANFGKPKANFSVGNVCVRNPLMPVNLSTPGLGSTAITNYLWNFGDGNYLTGSQPIYVYQNEGNYTLTLIVTSDSSCVADTLQKTVTVYGKPTASFKFENNCVNENTLFTNTSLPGFGQSLIGNSKWLFGDGGSSNNYNAAHIFGNTKDYVVQLTVSGNRCPNLTDSIKKVVTVHKPRDPVIYPRIEGVRGTPIQLYALSGGVQYNWIPITGLDNAGIQNPIGNYNVSHPNIINYTINITDSLGCKVKDKQEIWLFADADIFVPTAFTPNGDGANDILKPLYVNIAKINYFRIFDRWGKVVFETSDMGKGWDATLNGNNLPMETYSWMISAITQQGKELIRKGNATLIRN